MQCLIDGDLLVYRIGFACQKTRYFIGHIDLGTKKAEAKKFVEHNGGKLEDITSQLEVDPIENCLHSVKVAMQAIIDETKATSYRAFLTGKNNFRDELVDYYKANRKDAKKPYYYQQIRDYLIKFWNAEVQEGQEADDILSIVQYTDFIYADIARRRDALLPAILSQELACNTVICTIDKDLKNTPGYNYNFVTKVMEFITPEQADLNFYVQLITGDMTDNIPGLYQITGTKALAKLKEPLAYMDNTKDMWLYVVGVYLHEFTKWAEDEAPISILLAVKTKLKETGILLHMRREENEIWSPPKYEDI